MTDLFGEVIHAYTRAQALEDGVLVDVSQFPVTREHYKFPVAFTTAVWAIVDKAHKNTNTVSSYEGILHDMFMMSKMCFKELDESTRLFQVLISGAGRQKKFMFKIVVGPGDHGEPVITVMLADED